MEPWYYRSGLNLGRTAYDLNKTSVKGEVDEMAQEETEQPAEKEDKPKTKKSPKRRWTQALSRVRFLTII